eukprot:TRINITY_DN3136_c0_g1_i1.p1 TRINITY_DN3136_c0_g1~~TRINITY_DN3136_c0_g1_i1.p1  ORF type:complete len:347 (+),score=43.22 TRINITY_DN3136_c0_g1_i1:36-1076(+)
MDPIERWSLQWKYGDLEVQSLAGMLAPINFKMHDITGQHGERTVQPMMVAPWHSDSDEVKQKHNLPPILYAVRGEWPCVPFGSARAVNGLAPEWQKGKWEHSEGSPHGESSNYQWKLRSKNDKEIVLECIYPHDHAIEKLVRTITPDQNAAAVDVELEVHARSDVDLPFGLHPTIRLDEEAFSTTLNPGKFKFGMTFAGDLEPTSITKPGKSFTSLDLIEAKDGSMADFSKLPLDKNTENLLQLCGVDGTFEAINTKQHYTFRLEWNPEHFPSLLMWLSNRGRPEYPWSSRNICCGIEPVCAAFDLGTHVSTRENPISANGVRTYHSFKKGEIWKTKYRMSARSSV